MFFVLTPLPTLLQTCTQHFLTSLSLSTHPSVATCAGLQDGPQQGGGGGGRRRRGGDPDLPKKHTCLRHLWGEPMSTVLKWISGDGGGLPPPPPAIWLQSHSLRMAETNTKIEAERETAFGDSCLQLLPNF